MWYKTSNRKPYYDLKTSQKDFFTEHVRFIHESNTIESAFEKPYYDLQYNKMHLKGNWPNVQGGGFLPTAERGCAFIKNPSIGQEIAFSGGVVNSNGSMAAGPFNIVFGSGEGAWYRTCVFCVSPDCPGYSFGGSPEAKKFYISLTNEEGQVIVTGAGHCSGRGSCEGTIPANACDGKDQLTFNIRYTNEFCKDASSIPCESVETLQCDQCVGVEAMVYTPTWTAANAPPSIARNGSAVVEFTGGEPSFTWLIETDHFFFDGAHTITSTLSDTRSISIYADGYACGPCFINVSDSCGNSVGMYLLCTTNSGFLSITSAIAGDGLGTPVASPACTDTDHCLGATGSSIWNSSLSASNTIFYTAAKFTSPTLGDILVRIYQSITRATSLTRYAYLCIDYDCTQPNCAPECTGRILDTESCYITCDEAHAQENYCNVCSSNGLSIMVGLNNAVCSSYPPFDCYASCSTWGMQRIQNYSSGNPVYSNVCLVPVQMYRHYVRC